MARSFSNLNSNIEIHKYIEETKREVSNENLNSNIEIHKSLSFIKFTMPLLSFKF